MNKLNEREKNKIPSVLNSQLCIVINRQLCSNKWEGTMAEEGEQQV